MKSANSSAKATGKSGKAERAKAARGHGHGHSSDVVVSKLRSLVAIPVVLQDERLTSHAAEALLARREKDWRKRKPLIDAAAAAVILQDYLDSSRR